MANQDGVGFDWPVGLSLFDLRRIVWGRWMQRMPEVIADLSQKNVQLLLEDAYAIASDIQEVSDMCGFFILDGVKEPERFNPPDLPTCVLITQDGEFISPAKMQEILHLYNGHNLPEDLSSYERNVRIEQQRRRLVLTRCCRHDGCTATVVVTVGMAARAIRGHKLMELGLPYEPPSLCKPHRAERDAQLNDKRSRNKRGKKKKPLAVLGDVMPTAVKESLAPPEDTTDNDNLEPTDTKENTDGDCPVLAAPAVEEQAEV